MAFVDHNYCFRYVDKDSYDRNANGAGIPELLFVSLSIKQFIIA